ncbi:hypothetical protein [Pseudomonas sp. LRF_L74]|uniref:hypothetical protein n=1 Tax=Pseudomonas sp. LRF_L74 TaxID=3369422 RepID=UPI003F63C108
MSPLVISVLVAVGLVALIGIGYVNNLLENSKLEKARLKADLLDRIKRSRAVSENLPGQLMTTELKLLLSNMELEFVNRLQALEKHDQALAERIAELRGMTAKGEEIPIRNTPLPIHNEARAKEIRFILENLHNQITRAGQEKLLPLAEAKKWLLEIRHMLVQVHYELFTNQGQQSMQKGEPRQARLAYERGVQYLRKQPDSNRHKAQLQQLEDLLARADAMVLANTAPLADTPSELNESLEALGEDDWKKKNIYD